MFKTTNRQFEYFKALSRAIDILDELKQQNPKQKDSFDKVRETICKLAIEFIREDEIDLELADKIE